MTAFAKGDKVSMNNDKVQNMYGLRMTDEFEVDEVEGNFVRLTNGWLIKPEHLTDAYVTTAHNKQEVKDDFVLEYEVDEKVQDFLCDGLSFTAYDVTRSLREDFPNENIPHYKVKEVVHNMMDGDDTTKTLIDVGAPEKPWLYHGDNADVSKYVPSKGAQVLPLIGDELEEESKGLGLIRKFVSVFYKK